ncbi:MAG: hypothetical protein ACRCYX_04825 [Dermatophilaceae bacterium]
MVSTGADGGDVGVLAALRNEPQIELLVQRQVDARKSGGALVGGLPAADEGALGPGDERLVERVIDHNHAGRH